MIEYVLTVSMMFAGNSGEIKSFPFSGTYPTHTACVKAMTDKIQHSKDVWGVVLTPVGTDMCVPRETRREVNTAELQEAGCSAAGAAAAAMEKKLSARKLVEAATIKDCMQGKGIFAN